MHEAHEGQAGLDPLTSVKVLNFTRFTSQRFSTHAAGDAIV
jgi:hypothetical protein